MNTDYVAALVARDGLRAGNCRAARAEFPAAGMWMRGPAGFTVLFNAATQSDAQLLGDQSPGLQGYHRDGCTGQPWSGSSASHL